MLLILFSKWDNKEPGLASDGKADSVRVVEQICLVIADLKATTVSTKVHHSLFTDIEKYSISNPLRYMRKITINL